MKKMKKLLSALLAVAMLMSMVLPVSAEGIAVRVSDFELLEAAPAEEIVAPAPEVEIEEVTVEAEVAEASEASAQTITVDVPFSISVAYDEYADFLFTPAESGRYILHGVYGERLMTDVEVADNGNGVACDHWDHNDTNETGHAVTLNAGTTYKIRLNNWSDMSQINTTLTLTKATNYETFRLEQESTVAYVGGQANFYVKGTPIFAGEEITWTVSDESILPHFYGEGAWGNAECAAVGTVTVTATTASGLSDSCTITVKEAEAITGDSFDVTLDADGYAEYRFTPAEDGSYLFYYPSRSHSIGFELWDNETGRFQYSTSWQNADNSLRGNYFNLTGGMKYRVRVNNWWGDQAQSCTIGVTKLAPFDSIWFNGNATCYVGSEVHVTVAGSPEFSAGNISWSISDTSIVSENFADNSGITLNGLSAGTATVTATTDSGLSASFEVTVVDMPTIKGDSFDVSLPASGETAYLYTPAESGTYLFYLDDNTWNIGFTVYKYDDNEWIDRGDWANSQTGDHGNAFALTGGTTYRIVVDNHDSMDRFETVSIAKAVPYDNMWIEGNSVCYVGDWAYLNLRGTPDFAMEPAQWTVSNPNVVEVRYTGATAIDLIGLSVGTTTVTATTASGKTASFELTVAEMETITGNSFDVTIPAGSNMKYLFTPAEDGEYIFYLPNGVWSMGFNVRRQDNDNWVDGGDWENANSGYHGSVFALSKDVTYLLTVNNWDNYQMSATVSIAKAVPYDAFWIEGNNTCYVDSDVYLRVYGEPTFAAESVQWTISNPNVVEVDYSGTAAIRLFGRAVGTTTVTATTASGKTATFELKVKEMEALGTEPMAVTVPAGESMQVSFTPAESGNYIVYLLANAECGLEFWNMNAGEWNSDDGLYYGRAAEMTAGETAMIRLNNWRNYEQTVTVAAVKAVPYEHIAFRNAPMGFVGEEAYVQVTGGPGFAYSPIQWSSSNPDVASLTWGSGTGANFMCHAVGTTTITATTSNGLSVSYEMKVTEMPNLKVGETVLLEIPFEGHTQVLFTPEADGTYIFHYPANGYFGVQCRDENYNWPNSFEWNNSDDTRRGTGFALLRGVTYTLEVYNWNVQGIAELELTATKAVPYTKLGFAQDSYTGYVSNFQAVPLLLDYAPEYGGEELIVKSSNENVVVSGWVSGDCIYLSPVATGTATITVATVDGRLKDTCTVTVKEPIAITSGKEQSMTIESAGYALFKFTPTTSATYAFYCVDNDYFGFSVHDENGNWVETEDRWANNALIAEWEAVAGKTYYIPFNNNKEAKNTFKIGIGQSTKATGMTLTTQDFNLYPDWSLYLVPYFTPVLAEVEEVTWTSSNEKVAKFEETHEYDDGTYEYWFYCGEAGTATLTATSESGLKATIKITVKNPEKIGMGTKSVTVVAWDTAQFEFAAPAAGTYVIYDEDPDSVVGWYADKDNGSMKGYEDGNKKGVQITLAAGEVAWPVVQSNIDKTKTFTFTIEGAHEHAIKSVEAKAPTYTEDGYEAHFACDCGVLFADAEGTVEIEMDSIRIPMLIQISEGKAEVPKEVIDEFVAEVEQGGEVSIPVAEAGTNSKEEVKSTALPVESLTQIAEKEATLTVEMPTATVTMDTAVLAAVVEKAGENATVTLEVAEVAEEELTESQVAVIEQLEKKPTMTISAELLVNDQPIASKENGGFGENAKVTVKIPVGPGKADYTVLYIADDGTVENIPAVFENGFLILELEHFSDYAIIKNTVPGDVNDDGLINVVDLMYLANYFAKGETINKANADVNADGALNVLDLMYLANFFAGKETTLG